MDTTTIQRRVAAREQARVVAGLVVEEAGRIGPDAQAAFWEELRKMMPFPKPQAVAPQFEPMTDLQARQFGKSVMSFGEFRGTPIDEVPLERLQWYADMPFQKQLRRYLASQRIQGETSNEE